MPQENDKYVLCEGTKLWDTGAPAIITVKELLADAIFLSINTLAQTRIDEAVNVLTSNHSGLTITNIPSLFLGELASTNSTIIVSPHSAFAFNPGAANMQFVGGTSYVPRQYAPLNNTSQDIFEVDIKAALKGNVSFVDSWMYHVGFGNLHCGSNLKRTPVANWWDVMKTPPKP
jgi:hypothetical protein